MESLRTHVECPICYDVPRDGVMLVCANGHNVCAACKAKIDGNNSKCPQGQCDYNNPPTRNRAVENIIQSHQFEYACRFANVPPTGCDFKVAQGPDKALLEQHESACQHRVVHCPDYYCQESFPVRRIIEHRSFKVDHNVGTIEEFAGSNEVQKCFLWKQEYNSNHNLGYSWFSLPYKLSCGWGFPYAHFQNGQLYIWLQMVADISVTAKLKCQITLSKDDQVMTFTVPVYPIDSTWEKIVTDDDCACLSAWSIRKLLTEDILEYFKRDGYYAKLKATFKIVNVENKV